MNATRARTNELTLLAVISIVVMLFAAFSAAYLIRRTNADWQPVRLPAILWINTALLLVSSVTMELARRRSGRRWLPATIGLGVLFLAGQLFAWRTLAGQGIYVPTNPHSSFIYMLTAVHGLHLVGGIVALFWGAADVALLRLGAIYWHFVGGVWVYVLVMLSAL